MAEGGEREDDGAFYSTKARFYRHFHNPLLPWDQAGLRTRYPVHLEPHQYTSSIRWMQAVEQTVDDGGAVGEDRAWHNARLLYYRALTTADPSERAAVTADMFVTLGQIMHLVVDASVPEHVRNDPHPFGAISRRVLRNARAGSYEYWVSDQHTKANEQATTAATRAFTETYLSAPIGFDGRIFRIPPPSDERVARNPIARLIDTDTYRFETPDPNVTLGSTIGIAEFANANFFSEDTRLGVDTLERRLPFPRREDLIRRSDLAPIEPGIRSYFRKPEGQGLATNFALAECRLDGWQDVPAWSPFPCVDEAVWQEAATHMLPRAVGYARGVLDYFFRDSVRVIEVATNADGIRIVLENASDERMDGVFEVYARRQKGTAGERRERVSVLGGGAPITIGPGRSVAMPFSILPGDPTPYYILMFRGRIGLEEDAVVGRVFTVPHVQIVQETYDAAIAKSCTSHIASPSVETPLHETLICSWQPTNHRVQGQLITNLADSDVANPEEPAIDRIEAVWTGSVSGRAPLTIDGVPHPGGMWRRQGGEANPRRFEIADPAERRDSQLFLIVFLRGDHNEFSTQLATFKGVVTTTAEKRVKTIYGEELVRHLTASRRTRVEPNISRSFFAVASLGGFPVPTVRLRDQLSMTPNIWRDAVDVSGFAGIQHFVDVFEVFPFGDTAFQTRWHEIRLEAPFPQAPDLNWSAVVVPRPPHPVAQQFWQTFVATGQPPSAPIVLTGHAPEDH